MSGMVGCWGPLSENSELEMSVPAGSGGGVGSVCRLGRRKFDKARRAEITETMRKFGVDIPEGEDNLEIVYMSMSIGNLTIASATVIHTDDDRVREAFYDLGKKLLSQFEKDPESWSDWGSGMKESLAIMHDLTDVFLPVADLNSKASTGFQKMFGGEGSLAGEKKAASDLSTKIELSQKGTKASLTLAAVKRLVGKASLSSSRSESGFSVESDSRSSTSSRDSSSTAVDSQQFSSQRAAPVDMESRDPVIKNLMASSGLELSSQPHREAMVYHTKEKNEGFYGKFRTQTAGMAEAFESDPDIKEACKALTGLNAKGSDYKGITPSQSKLIMGVCRAVGMGCIAVRRRPSEANLLKSVKAALSAIRGMKEEETLSKKKVLNSFELTVALYLVKAVDSYIMFCTTFGETFEVFTDTGIFFGDGGKFRWEDMTLYDAVDTLGMSKTRLFTLYDATGGDYRSVDKGSTVTVLRKGSNC